MVICSSSLHQFASLLHCINQAMIQGSRERSFLKKKVADLKSLTKIDNMRTLKFVTLIVASDTVLEFLEESGNLEMSGITRISQDLHHYPNPLTSAKIDMHRPIETHRCFANTYQNSPFLSNSAKK